MDWDTKRRVDDVVEAPSYLNAYRQAIQIGFKSGLDRVRVLAVEVLA